MCVVVPDAYIQRIPNLLILAACRWVLIIDRAKPLGAALVASVVQWSRDLLPILPRHLLLLSVDFDWVRLSLGLRSNSCLCLVSECHVRFTNNSLLYFSIRILWYYMLLQVIPGFIWLAALILVHGQILWRMRIVSEWVVVILPKEGWGENIRFRCGCAAANAQLPGIDGY